MNIKINDFSALTHKKRLEIVTEYLNQFEDVITLSSRNNCFIELENNNYNVKTTLKYPIKLTVGNSNYHIKCKKTKTLLIFDIWLAV